jgi:predicted amidohydrolase
MHKATLRIGAATLTISKAQKEGLVFYDRLFGLCERVLPGCGCDIVLLPERAAVREEEKQPLDGAIGRRFGELAKRHGLWLIAPLAEAAGGALYNTQAVFSPQGRIVHAYRKVHLAPGEEKDTAEGTCFEAFELPWMRAGVQICYDNHFPEPSRCLAVQGAAVVFWPAFGDLRNLARTATRCLDSNIYMIASGVIDMACNLPAEAFSRGLIMDPAGKVLAEAEATDGLVTAELPVDAATGRLVPFAALDQYLSRRRPGSYSRLVG